MAIRMRAIPSTAVSRRVVLIVSQPSTLKLAGIFATCVFLSVAGSVSGQDFNAATGEFRIEATTTDILNESGAETYADVVSPTESMAWEVAVPKSYDPEDPPGVLVYISPSDSGEIPRGWNRALATHNLIWIGANQSGNPVPVALRMTKALLAAALINKRYTINKERIYIAGFSGGARVSGLVASVYPTLFRGAIYIGGAESWDESIDTTMLEHIRSNRYVFVAGSDDFNRTNVSSVRKFYRDRGVVNTDIIILHQTGHELPKRSKLSDAIEYLDASDERSDSGL